MSHFAIFDIAGSAMQAQSVRLSTIASNLANANSVANSPDKTYQPIEPIFEAQPYSQQTGLSKVHVKKIATTTHQPLPHYAPNHPLADSNGYVYAPDIDPVAQMVNMIDTSRNYQANVEMISTARDLMMSTLTLNQ